MNSVRKYDVTGLKPSEIKMYLKDGDVLLIPIENVYHVLKEFEDEDGQTLIIRIRNGNVLIAAQP